MTGLKSGLAIRYSRSTALYLFKGKSLSQPRKTDFLKSCLLTLRLYYKADSRDMTGNEGQKETGYYMQ